MRRRATKADATEILGELDDLVVPPTDPTARPDPRGLPHAPVTRFAPAPTGHLHMGHLVNALYTWGIARATGGRVVLRIEDHDRGRSRAAYEAELLEDLKRLGLAPDVPTIEGLRSGPSPYRQSDSGDVYRAALGQLREAGLVYACACSRAALAASGAERGQPWRGPGCPSGCRARRLAEEPGRSLRALVGPGAERWDDLLLGPMLGEAAAGGDPVLRDRLGNWTYAFCVVVDDDRQGVDLVIRGRDLTESTATQVRLARLLGRQQPPRFLHHPLVRKRSGAKLSKSDGDTSVRALLEAGHSPARLFGLAARLAGLRPDIGPIEPADLGSLFGPL